MSKMIIR